MWHMEHVTDILGSVQHTTLLTEASKAFWTRRGGGRNDSERELERTERKKVLVLGPGSCPAPGLQSWAGAPILSLGLGP